MEMGVGWGEETITFFKTKKNITFINIIQDLNNFSVS